MFNKRVDFSGKKFPCFRFGKRGIEWELKELFFAVLLLLIGIGMIVLLYLGKGGAVLDSIRKMFRFGRILLPLI